MSARRIPVEDPLQDFEEPVDRPFEGEEPEEAQAAPAAPVEDLKRQLEEAQGDRLRAIAEMENLKKRLSREKEDYLKYATENLLADMLPVLDNLDLALTHGKGVAEARDFITGVEMTRKIFMDTLAKHGLTAVGEPGEAFDPQFHEALGYTQCGDGSQKDRVAEVVQRGYLLKGRLLRPAKVLLGG